MLVAPMTAFGMRCWGQSLKSPQKGVVPGDNGTPHGLDLTMKLYSSLYDTLNKVRNRHDHVE